MFLFAAVFLVLSVYFVSTSKTQQKFKLPPGPRSIPIIGNFHWHAKFPWKHFVNYRKIYGPIVCLKLGKQRLVLLNEIAAWKEAFCRPEFSRFSSNLFASILENKSIIFGDGNPEIKHYMTKVLVQFGQHSLEDLTLDEVSLLLKNVSQLKDKPIKVQALFAIPTVNILWRLLFGNRIEDDDKCIHEIAKDVAGSSKDSGFLGRQSPLLWIPFMSKLFPSISTNEIMKKWLFKLLQTMKERIRHQAKTRQNSEVRNITDAYFDKEEELRTNSKSFFYGGNTQHFVYSGLFLAAVDSTSTSLEWMLLFLATNPLVQKKFQAEIDYIIGSRKPSLGDRERMPYTLAVIQEMFRLSAIDLIQVHLAKENSHILGYDIPKGSILIPNVFGINRNPEVWDEPNQFRPERFINDDGTFQRSDKFITFGYGKRSCLGESMARNEVFLFITSLFQAYFVEIHGDAPPFEGGFRFLHHPENFQVTFTRRENGGN